MIFLHEYKRCYKKTIMIIFKFKTLSFTLDPTAYFFLSYISKIIYTFNLKMEVQSSEVG